MTAVLDTAATAESSAPDARLASWPARVGALVVDVVPGAGVIATAVLLALAADGWMRSALTVLGAVTLLLVAVNRLVLPHVIGWTLGRALFGIEVVHRSGRPVGVGRLAARELAHLLDTSSLFVGWLWPLWDRRHRTFADLLLRTEVRRTAGPQRNVRPIVAYMLVGAVVVCAAAVGLSYTVVYRHDRAVDSTREQITEQGPRIVEQMLSYGVDTMAEDFARAQELTTEDYRPQLITQQEAIQGAEPTTNEYWAVSSAVLTDPPVTPDHAAMLLAMQGQRGSNPDDLRFITATVRVEFVRSSEGSWQVANLTVLKKPMMNQAGQ